MVNLSSNLKAKLTIKKSKYLIKIPCPISVISYINYSCHKVYKEKEIAYMSNKENIIEYFSQTFQHTSYQALHTCIKMSQIVIKKQYSFVCLKILFLNIVLSIILLAWNCVDNPKVGWEAFLN